MIKPQTITSLLLLISCSFAINADRAYSAGISQLSADEIHRNFAIDLNSILEVQTDIGYFYVILTRSEVKEDYDGEFFYIKLEEYEEDPQKIESLLLMYFSDASLLSIDML